MGFLDNIFDDDGFVGRLGETLQDAGWFVGAPAAAVFDVARAGLPGGEPFVKTALSEVTKNFQRGTQLFFGDENDPNNPNDDRDNVFSPGIKTAMDSLEWVYDNAIAQPLNFLNIETQRGLADFTGTEDGTSILDVGSAWRRADESKGGYDGKGTSIGREWGYGFQAVQDLVTGWGRDNRFSTLTDEGQRALNEGKSWKDGGLSFDVMSGGVDATSRIFLDPTIVLGKTAKALRLSQVVAALKPGELESKLADTTDKVFAGFGHRQEKAIQFASEPDRSAGELMAAFPGLQENIDGASVASVMEQANKTLRAAGKSDDEVADQMRLIVNASNGYAPALKEIDDQVAFAKDALAAMSSKRDDLKTASEWATSYSDRVTPDDIADAAEHLDLVKDLEMRGRDYFTSDNFIKLTDARLKSVSKDLQAAEQEAARQQRVRNLFLGTEETPGIAGSMSDRPMLAGALRGASTKGLETRAARERGEQVGLDFVFQSTLWNKGIKYTAPHLYLGQKAFGAYGRMAQPSVIDVHDEKAPMALDSFLKHSKIDPEERLGLVSKLAAARGEQEKGRIMETAISRAQESMVRAYREKNPHFTDEVEKLVNAALVKEGAKDRSRTAAHTQMFTAHKTDEGARADLRIGDDGQAEFYPLLETQLVNQFKLPDLKKTEHILRRHSNWITDVAEWTKGNRAPDPSRVKEIAARVFDTTAEKFPGFDVRTSNRAQMVNDFVWKSEESAKLFLEGFNKIWKYGTLATRPLAYSMRVNIDSGMRMAAALGPAAWMMHAAPRTFGYATIGTASGAKAWLRSYKDSGRELELRKAMERIEDAHAGQTGDRLAEGVDETYDALKAEQAALSARLDLYRTGGRKGRREAYGAFGEAGYKSIQTRAGELEGAFSSAQGKTDRWIISSETSAAIIGDSSKLALKSAQLGNWTYVKAGEPQHMENWLHAVNAQLLQSTVGKQAVQFMNEFKNAERASRALARWATGTPEGRQIMGRLQWTAADKTAYSREIVGYVNHYLPGRQLQELAAKNGRVKQTDLESALPSIEDRPPVHGESIAIATGRGSVIGEQINNAFSSIMRWASDATEDQLARHPMYAAVYEQEVKRRAEFLMADPRIESLTGGDIRRLVQDQAHKKARQSIKNYMFDVAATSDLSHYMRFTSPFIAAWEDTVRKWGRIAVENPDIPGKAYLVWNAPNDLGIVVDENGNPVESDDFTDNTYLVIPHGISKHLPGGGDSDFKISKQAFNLVLQGGLQPGFGPLVAYPVGKIQTAAPELNDIAKIVNPYGPPESFFDAVAPSTLKALTDATNDQSRTHQQDTRRIYAQLLTEYRLDPQKFGGKEPTIDEAAKKAGALGRLKILNRVTNPFPTIFQSPYQMYVDAYRTLNERERSEGHPRGWADDQFMKGYGESYFPLVQSESLNNAGLGSSKQAVQATEKYRSLISKFGVEAGQANPNLIRLIVGQEGEGDFNASAHQWQETREISPASGLKFRSYDNPQAAQAQADADLGWYKYRQFMNQVDAMALEQGLRTYSEDPELVATRKEFIANLQAENEAWHVEWSQRDSDKFERDLGNLEEIATSGKFGPMRKDMVGVQQYLALRGALLQQLDELDIRPGTQDAQPFRQEFTDAVQSLVSQNSQFAEWSYYTFLERDPLLEPPDPTHALPTAPTDWGFDA